MRSLWREWRVGGGRRRDRSGRLGRRKLSATGACQLLVVVAAAAAAAAPPLDLEMMNH